MFHCILFKLGLSQSPTMVITYIYKKRGTVCPHLQAEGPENCPNKKDGLSSSTP